jgi:hypothetical protein
VQEQHAVIDLFGDLMVRGAVAMLQGRTDRPVQVVDPDGGRAELWPKPPTRPNALGLLILLWESLPVAAIARRLGMSTDELIARMDALAPGDGEQMH